MKLTTGYKKPIASSGTDALELSSNNSYLLLAGGGHKALSELVSPADLTTELSNYVTIGSNQTITGVKTFSLTINADITGNAATATKLKTAIKIFLNTGAVGSGTNFDGSSDISIPITSVKESYLEWGGKNFSASYGCIDAAMIPELGANRLAFMPASGVDVQYSTDDGSTWLTYPTNDTKKINLFNGNSSSYNIGASTDTGIDKSQYQLRVIITTDIAKVYTALNKFCIYCSTNGSLGCWCTIDAKTKANVDSNTDTWVTFADKVGIKGWSGYNIINTSSFTTYGNDSRYYQKVRFTFGVESHPSSSVYSGLTILKIMGFGGVGWVTPSTMAATGRMYTYDAFKNVTFPATVTAVSFNGNASSATKLTSSAGSVSLPIYFSEGMPVACTASSIFSNLSNNGNNISITIAGQNRLLTVAYATSAGNATNADTVDGEHAVAFAHIGAHNNLTVNNEFTFASNGFSGDIWFNYRTAGGTNGNITDYIFGNGKGGQLYSLKTIATNASTAYNWGNHANAGYLLRSDIGSLSVNYATNAGNAGTLNGHTADDFVLKTTHDVYESVIVESLNDLDNRKIEVSDLPTSLPANGGHAATATNVDWSGVTNKPSSLPANGGNADTINGYSSSDFVLNTNYGEFKSVVATALTDLDTRKVDVSDLVDYEVIITEQGASGNTLKSYVITLGGSNIGTISIPKDLILSSGSVVVGNWVNGIFTEDSSGTGKAIKLVISNQSDPIYINVQDLSDVYTVQQGATEVQLAISSTNEISAALVKNVRDKIDNAIPKVSGATGKVAQFKADGNLESSSYEIKKSVPSDAVFTDTTYSIATSDTLGLVKIGYVANDKNYPVQLSDGQMYVNVPWTDSIEWKNVTNKPSSFMPSSHTHTTSEITGLPTSLPANGGNSDTVDNMHASDFATAGHTHSDYVTALGTSDIYLTWTKNGNTSNIIVPYAELAGDAGTLGGWHKSAFATAKHTHTTSEITDFPIIGNGALHIKVNGTELTPEGGIFTANKSGDSTIDLKESLATRPEINTLGDRMDKIDTSILDLNNAIRVDNPFDDPKDDDEDTAESNNNIFGDNVVGSIDLRFYGITSEITTYVGLHVYFVSVAKICDISEVGNSISSLYNIRITIDLTGTTIASTVGISSDTFKQFYIRGANMKNHICGFDVRGNGTTNTATAIMSGKYLLLNCQLKLHGDKSNIGSFIMEEAKNGNFKAYLCLRQTI